MAQPAAQDLIITRGDTETFVITIKAEDDSVVDITGRTYRAQIRSKKDSTTISATFTCTVAFPTTGQITCVLSATTTAALTPGLYYWDFEENASGIVTTILSGEVTVLADVTR